MPTNAGCVPDILNQVLDRLTCLKNHQDIFDFLVEWLHEYSHSSIAGVALCNESSAVGTVVAVKTDKVIQTAAEALLRHKLVGSPIKIPHQLRQVGKLNHASWDRDIYGVKEPYNLGLKFGFESVYGYPISYVKTECLIVGIVMRRGQDLTPHQKTIIELVLKQAQLALTAFTELDQGNVINNPGYLHESELFIENDTIVHCSPSALAVFGCDAELLLNRKFAAWISAQDAGLERDVVKRHFRSALQGELQCFETTLTNRLGQKRFIEFTASPLRLPAGRTVVRLLAVDISSRKQMETALNESQARYKELFETSIDGLATTDEHGFYVDCNEAFCKLLGYDSADNIKGKNYMDLTPEEYHALDYQKVLELNDKHYVEYEKEYIHKTGGRVLVWIRLWRRFDTLGRYVGGWVLVRDITTIRRMENQVGDIEKFKVLGELAAAISHEIRNPLTTVRGFLQLLSAKQAYVDDRGRFKLMMDEIDLASTIIKDFLDLARPADPRKISFSLTELLDALVRVLESKAIILRVNTIQKFEPDLEICGDPSQLRQVFLNLIQNAFQAMPEGGKLEITAERDGQNIIVRIIDTGIGIPAAVLPRLGRPFFTTKPGGTGLGLTTCFRIISNHNGRIDVSSQEGVGTTFRVILPTKLDH